MGSYKGFLGGNIGETVEGYDNRSTTQEALKYIYIYMYIAHPNM